MTHAFHHQIDSLIKTNKLHRLESELLDLKSNNNKEKLERIEILQNIIDKINARKDTQQIKEELIKNHIRLLKDSQYQKKWQFLNVTQKNDRIDELSQRLNITDPIIASRLKKYIASGLLKTRNITYNVPKGIIDSINVLKIDDDNNYQLLIADNDDEDNENPDVDNQNNENNKKISKIAKSKKNSNKIVKDIINKPTTIKQDKLVKSMKSNKQTNPTNPKKMPDKKESTIKKDSVKVVSTAKKKLKVKN